MANTSAVRKMSARAGNSTDGDAESLSKSIEDESNNDSTSKGTNNFESVSENIQTDIVEGKRQSLDLKRRTKLRNSEVKGNISKRVSASKLEEDMHIKGKKKQAYRQLSEQSIDDYEKQTSGRKHQTIELKHTLAKVLGRSVPDHIRSFMHLFSNSEDTETSCKDSKASWGRKTQRKSRYKEAERSVGRYEPITIYTKLKKNQWKLTVPSNSICYDDVELTDDQRRELRKAFLMFEKGGKNKMAARDLGELLRCLGWNPSERELEEARHELVVSARGSVSFSEIERYVARRGGICNGCKDEDDIQEAFQVLDQDGDGKISVNKFKHFMTTLGEKMSDSEVDEILQSLKKDKDNTDYLEYKDLIEGLEDTSLDDS